MSDSRPIQRYTNNTAGSGQVAGAIMTAQGPAVIQVIDMPTGLGPVNYGGAGARKVGGINVIGAVIRRWWLVLMVFMIVGGGAVVAGSTFVKPQWEGRAKLAYIDNNANPNGGGIASTTIHRNILLMNSGAIPLLAATDEELRARMPRVFKRDLNDPAERAALLKEVRDLVDTEESLKGISVVDVIALQPTREEAEAVANAYVKALKTYCEQSINETIFATKKTYEEQLEEGRRLLATMQKKKLELRNQHNFDVQEQILTGTLKQISALNDEINKSRVLVMAAEAKAVALKNNGQRSPAQELERLKIIEEEKGKDQILKEYYTQLIEAHSSLTKLQATNMTEQHPAIVTARRMIKQAEANIKQQEDYIAGVIEKRIADRFGLEAAKTVDEAQTALSMAKQQLTSYTDELARLMKEAGKVGEIKLAIEELDRTSADLAERNKELAQEVARINTDLIKNPTATFKVEQWAQTQLKDDKRIKVQAGGLVGGLFLGILLALLVDKFDKRLRDPRDIEPLFGAALLGTIPRIQELKRVKGEQARNLIAEEFRIIRTQVLFGNPNLSHKLIAITSPTPGDGKTSLAVNLAISIAKAGRRVLLIDGDLRKPDVHRVFNISESPGLAELIQGSHEPGAAIKKSEIDGLEILPAGTPMSRPSELLSRPEMARLLAALGELYDHIILDTAPLLPVSDTHVLAGMVDGVIVSFNAEVDRDTVSLTQDILRRSRANVIGSVMNQVKYRQSGSFHRGKSAYDSYYNSPRGAKATGAKPDNVATLTKP